MGFHWLPQFSFLHFSRVQKDPPPPNSMTWCRLMVYRRSMVGRSIVGRSTNYWLMRNRSMTDRICVRFGSTVNSTHKKIRILTIRKSVYNKLKCYFMKMIQFFEFVFVLFLLLFLIKRKCMSDTHRTDTTLSWTNRLLKE